jgi:2-amino-4-hydroxy-6-hydroxymethyldihydropteridine diphosphokinase
MEWTFLMLGSNLGDRYAHLHEAKSLLTKCLGKLIKESSIYETASWGDLAQPSFLNQALLFHSKLSPNEILDKALSIEKKMGRIRDPSNKNAGRIIDIDLIYYGHQVLESPELSLPHPRLQERRFVLAPLQEMAPAFIHPLLGKSQQALLLACTDPLEVRQWQMTAYDLPETSA